MGVGRISFQLAFMWHQLWNALSSPKHAGHAYEPLSQYSSQGSTEPIELIWDPEPAARKSMDRSSIKSTRQESNSVSANGSCVFSDVIQASSQVAAGDERRSSLDNSIQQA